MFAIVEVNGNQYRIEEGTNITTDRLPGEVGGEIVFDKVLLLSEGDDVKVGTPYIEGAQVSAQITEHGKEKRKIVFRYHSKNRYRKMKGHRQPQTRSTISKINPST